MKEKKSKLTRAAAFLLAGLTGLMSIPIQAMGTLSVSAVDYTENGFGTEDSSVYQPATLNDAGTADDTSDDYYEVENAGQLYWFAGLVNGTLTGVTQNTSANAKLTADIVVNTGDLQNCNGEDTGDWLTWTPIGIYSATEEKDSSYTGTFDGQGKTVSGLFFSNRSKSYVGLFGRVDSGTVQNVGVVNSYLYGWYNVGGICGVMANGKIKNCYNTGAIQGGTQNTGGVCGYLTAGTISGCYNTGDVKGSASGTGGVVGVNPDGTILNCYNTGTVGGTANSGGVCGANYDGMIVNCYNVGAVEGYGSMGGICARNDNGIISNVYFDATVFTGDAVQKGSGGESENIYKTTEAFTDGTVAWLLNGGSMIDDVSYSGTGWEQRIGYDITPVFDVAPTQENGTYLIENAGDLYWFAGLIKGTLVDIKKNVAADAKLTADIVVNEGDVSGCDGTKADDWIEWTPIGNYNEEDENSDLYSGHFDGQGHTISGLYFNDENQNNVGLFGYTVSNAKIQNVGVINSYLKGRNNVGGVCGYTYYGTITNSYNNGTVSGTECVGGVCGCNGGTITNSYNTGIVEATKDSVGGVCGWNYGVIANSYFNSAFFDGKAVGINDAGTIAETVLGKTTAQFKRGEVAHLLHQGCTVSETADDGAVWRQEIGTDAAPLLDSEKPMVYKVTFDYDDTSFDAETESIATYTNGMVDFTAVPSVDYYTIAFTVNDEPVSDPYSVEADTTILVEKMAVPVQVATDTIQMSGTYQSEIKSADLSEKVLNADAVNGVTYALAEENELPNGLILDAETGKISGTPTIAVPDGMEVSIVVTGGNGTTAILTVSITITTTESGLLKGDADLNGEITIHDAFLVLLYDSQHAVGNDDYAFSEDSEKNAAILQALDINGDNNVDTRDAFFILLYSSYQSVGNDVTWEDLLA